MRVCAGTITDPAQELGAATTRSSSKIFRARILRPAAEGRGVAEDLPNGGGNRASVSPSTDRRDAIAGSTRNSASPVDLHGADRDQGVDYGAPIGEPEDPMREAG